MPTPTLSCASWSVGMSRFWVSPRSAIQAAEFKPTQLHVARSVDLPVPRTLITTNPEAAVAFFEECRGSVVSKAVAPTVLDTSPVKSSRNCSRLYGRLAYNIAAQILLSRRMASTSSSNSIRTASSGGSLRQPGFHWLKQWQICYSTQRSTVYERRNESRCS